MEKIINSGHYHEIADRCHVINSMIDEILIGHPGMTEAMTKDCQEVQSILCRVMNTAWYEQDLFEKKRI